MGYFGFRASEVPSPSLTYTYLTLLPEKEKARVLSVETVKPLIEALLTYEPDKNSKLVANERAFMIAYLLAMKGENGFDMIKSPYNTMLFDQPCRKRAMLLVMQLSEMKFLRSRKKNTKVESA